MSLDNSNFIPIPKSNKPRLIIIGGGFAGIKLIKGLNNKGLQIVLFDRHNYHTFQPLLYQVATAGLEPDSIAGPLRKQLENYNDYFFRLAKVLSIDAEKKTIHTEIGVMGYDYLVIATGSKTNYFGNKTIINHAFPLKQIPQALDLRSHILQNFERAVIENDPSKLKKQMNVVVVGGGPTGVEVAGAFGELKKNVLPSDYPELDFNNMKIYLIEGLPRLLNGMAEESGEKAVKYLSRFDVEVKLGRLVKSFDGETVILDNGETIDTFTVIWAAGVMGNVIKGLSESCIEGNRLVVDEFNQVSGQENVYALGDVAMMKTPGYPKGHPMLAPVAMQQGERLAKNLVLQKNGKPMVPFQYRDKGSMATVGRNKAVVDFPGNLRFGGLMAWLVWMFVHLISIIGLRNKIVIFSNWVWNYFTYDRGTRLIIRPFKKNVKDETKLEPQDI